ncbi:Helix-turn-helix domain-containing protein [Lentzea albidocapillata subsp. violacea]|uniref:Helix-turn-helix domain-containing protein n=1 Tax=Lentzea albidocapillata subsp. violacea TaxID=128104 RepID=A0A1G9VEF6_9PSEU|nr:helix-turn-helix transcriptional regulator [Lentzea albidocapillata]SDM70463.1 Helix-turn-helix domain-containing protein [Lentzea albidocapillata subsp. violacea]
MSDPTFRQVRLGDALKRLRERAGLSQREAAFRLRYNYQKLSRIENGQLPEFPGLRAMLDLYGVLVTEEAPFIDMWERASEKGWWHPYGVEDQGYLSLEHDAIKVCEFSLGYIPGLLQVESYMRAVFLGWQIQHSRKWIENQIAIRTRRQQRLDDSSPLQYRGVIAEAALRQADREQLLHVSDRGLLPNVTVQVLPDAAGLHDGQNGPFTVLDFAYPGEMSVLYVEHPAGSTHVEDVERVKAAKLVFKHLSKLALTPDESAEWIGRLAAER